MLAVFSTTLKCQSCLSKVRLPLDQEPSIVDWSADLSDPKKLLRVELKNAGDVERVISIVDKAGFSASLLTDIPETEVASTSDAFDLVRYKPLLLVVAYVLGATALAEIIHGAFVWQRAMSYFMGFFFLGFAFFKLLNISGFADAFATYDIVARRSRAYAMFYPWIEVTLGVLFVSQVFLVVANLATALIMGVGLIGVISAVRENRQIQCACLGTVFNLPMSIVTIIENTVMIAMAISMLIMERIA